MVYGWTFQDTRTKTKQGECENDPITKVFKVTI